MKTKFLRITLVSVLAMSLLSLLFTACQKNGGGIVVTPVDDNPKIKASIHGVVVNENNQPIAGALVKSGTATTLTDNNGVFRFNNIDISAANGNVSIEKAGYFTGARSFLTIANRIHNVRIKLLPKVNVGSFQGNSGGTLNLPGGGKMVIGSAATADANGVTYAGTVNVAMTWIDPTATDLPVIIPGDLRGITVNGEERGLQTFGMLGVEMTGSSGQLLNIIAGKTAQLTFPIPYTLQGIAPVTIDLWYFDQASARWKQEGTATRTGTNYVGEVSHFSFWNCDAPFPVVGLSMKLVKSGSTEPINNALVKIRRTTNNIEAYSYTDSLGNLYGIVPAGEPLVLEVLDQCSNTIYSQNIGPFSNSTDIGTLAVSIPSVNSLTITGKLTNCNNANVTNGSVYINTAGGYSYSAPVTNGNFALTILNCNTGNLNFSVTGVDYTTLQQGSIVNRAAASGTVDIGTLQACSVSASEYVEMTVDGTRFNYAVAVDSIGASSMPNTGTYSLMTYIEGRVWANTTSISLSFPNNATPGNYPLNSCIVRAGGTIGNSQNITSASPTVSITNFGSVNSGFIQGTFSVQMNFSGTTRNVSGNFRVRRNN